MRNWLKLLIIGIFLQAGFQSVANAQLEEDRIYQIKDFSKMRVSAVNPFNVDNNAAIDARNLRANVVVGSLKKRDEMLSYGSCGLYAIKSLHRYYLSDDTKYLISSGSTFLEYGDDDAGTCTELRDQLTDSKRFTFVTYKDVMIGCNGVDACQKWDGATTTTADTDGARTVSILTADLGAPFAELNTGTDLDASSWYQYRMAYYDGVTYYYSTARSNPILTGSSVYNIALTGIPLGPAGTTTRYIYRTVGDSSRANVEADTSFYLVTTISDNTTTTFSDTVDDATLLGDSAPTWSTVSGGTNVTPPIVKFITIHKERLWGANNPTYNSDVYWSAAFFPDYFVTGTDYEQIRPDDGDEITFLKNFRGSVAIGKTNTISMFFTDNSDTSLWPIPSPYSFVGCPAPYTAEVTPVGVIYLGRNGIYTFNGENSSLISDVVSPDVRDILSSNYGEAAAIYFDNVYQLAYTSEDSGAAVNDSVLVLDLVRDAYVIDDKNIDSWEVFDSGSDFGTVYAGSSAADGNILAQASSPSELIHRYKSDLEDGTTDSVAIAGTEDDPNMTIAWNVTIDSATLAGVTLDSAAYATATIDRNTGTGYWYSDIIQIDANSLDKIYWNESLGSSGDVTFAVRLASTEAGVSSASWSSEFSGPSGSDISGVTANTWIQLRATLTTSDLTQSPTVFQLDNFVIRILFSKEGAGAETSILSIFKRGFDDFGIPYYLKRIRSIAVYYEGDTGSIVFNLKNSEGDINQSFTIDLTVNPDDSNTDAYTGNNLQKRYLWSVPLNSSTQPSPIGEAWQFEISDTGIKPWSVHRILVRYNIDEVRR